jgi:hypothetical protein
LASTLFSLLPCLALCRSMNQNNRSIRHQHAFTIPTPLRTQLSASDVAQLPPTSNGTSSFTRKPVQRQHAADVSPTHSADPMIPADLLGHLQALQSYERQQVMVGLMLAREGKLKHFEALQGIPVATVMRWWHSMNSYENMYGSRYHYSNDSSQRSSNASSLQSSFDPRMSFGSDSSANTHRSSCASFSSSTTQQSSTSDSSVHSFQHLYGKLPSQNSSARHRFVPDVRTQHQSGLFSRTLQPSTEPSPVTQPTTPSKTCFPPSTSLPRTKIYYCTCCAHDPYSRRSDWLTHEKEHHRHARWPCYCGLEFTAERTFRSHHSDCHACQKCDHAKDAMVVTQAKQSFGCGFCGRHFHSLEIRNNHVADHYNEGKTKNDWDNTMMIQGLLQLPYVALAWKTLMATRGHGSNAANWPKFVWGTDESASIVASLEYQQYGSGISALLYKLYTLGKKSRSGEESLQSTPRESKTPPRSPSLVTNFVNRSQLTSARVAGVTSPSTSKSSIANSTLRTSPSNIPRPDSSVLGDTMLPHAGPFLPTRLTCGPTTPLELPSSNLGLHSKAIDFMEPNQPADKTQDSRDTGGQDALDMFYGDSFILNDPMLAYLNQAHGHSQSSQMDSAQPHKPSNETLHMKNISLEQESAATYDEWQKLMEDAGYSADDDYSANRISYMQIDSPYTGS